jgi:hypothetical protein
MENTIEFKERRKHPRSLVDLPVEYRIKDLPHAHLIFTHKLGRWTQGALRQIPHPPPDLPLEGEGT